MTRARFDPRLINIYKEPRLLLHFEWGTDNKIYRYALVEKIDISLIKIKPINLTVINFNQTPRFGL